MNLVSNQNGIFPECAKEAAELKVVYRWDWEEQRMFDLRRKRKKARRGAFVFACVMTAALLLCMGMLAGVIVAQSRTSTSTYTSGGVTVARAVSEKVMPSTVLIYTTNSTSAGYGTGFFIRSDGYIVTNYHVIKNAEYISVKRYGENREIEAELIGGSEIDDVAVIRIRETNCPAVTIGNSDTLHIGDIAIAIGNPGGKDAPWTTTQGIISSVTREISVGDSAVALGEMSMIQTDAPVNPGNSGGPLCNDRGEVIGIVTRKITEQDGIVFEGIGFAIPINAAMKMVDSILRTGGSPDISSSVTKVRPTIGISGSSIEKGDDFTYMGEEYFAPENGVLVASITVGGAAEGKLNPGDVIVAIDGKRTPDIETLIQTLYTYQVGDVVTLTVYPLGETTTVDVKITVGVASSK